MLLFLIVVFLFHNCIVFHCLNMSLSIYKLMDIGCFQFKTIINNADMKSSVYVSQYTDAYVSFKYISKTEIADP